MREIKFRAWDKISGGKLMYNESISGCTLQELKGDIYQEHLEFMQYTGLKDKNGVEIYEADVVRYNTGETWLAGWNAREAGFVFKNGYIVDELDRRKPSGIGYGQNPGMHEVEVIGNIYENPELSENE